MEARPVEFLDDLEYYEQDSGANITYQYVVKLGTMGLLSSGRVRLVGPTTKAQDVHDGWDQVYLILSGKGSVPVGKEVYPVGPQCVVRAPRGTAHAVILKEGEELEYCYFNAFVDQAALDGMLST